MQVLRVPVLVAAALMLAGAAQAEDQPSGEQFVALFNKMFGDQSASGYRANHAKGILATGTFTPSKAAAGVSKAAHFQKAVPVTVRFSSPTGIAAIPDTDPNAFPKGMAIKFSLPDNSATDIVALSVKVFAAATPAEIYGVFKAVSESGPGSPHPSPIESFIGSHPAVKRFVSIPKPPPVSYGSEAYYGLNAFRFTNAKGTKVYGRYIIEPVGGVHFLDKTTAAKMGPNYLEDELGAHLTKTPISFKLWVQLAKKGDPIDDSTKDWPASNPKVELGTVTLTGLMANDAAVQRQMLFTPVNLTDGIEASNDPIIQVRAEAYAVSYAKRAQ